MKSNKGVSLITMILIVVVMTIIASIAITNSRRTITDANDSQKEQEIATVKAAISQESLQTNLGGVLTPANSNNFPGVQNPVIGTDEYNNPIYAGNDWYLLDENALEELGIQYTKNSYVVDYQSNQVYLLEDFKKKILENYDAEAEHTITFVYGDEHFTGNNYLDSGIALFGPELNHQYFKITTNMSDFKFKAGEHNNIISSKDESVSNWPGFALRCNSSNAFQISVIGGITTPISPPSNINITRENDTIYYNGESICDYSNYTRNFDYTVWFGAGADANKNPYRYSVVNLNNISIQLKYDRTGFNNLTLPQPYKTDWIFAGWYTPNRNPNYEWCTIGF